MIKNLGVFAISFFIILLAFLFYFIIKKCGGCCKLCIKIREKVYKKLFYNGPFRYITEGYLKLFNDFLTLFLFAVAHDLNWVMLIQSSLYIILLTVWPIWSIYFLLKNQTKLEEPVFKQKFSTIYQGIKPNSFKALCYNAVFSVRRLNIILINVYLTKDSPLSGLDRTYYLHKILCFLLI